MNDMVNHKHMEHIIGDKKACLLPQESVRKTRRLWEDTFFKDSRSFLEYYFSEKQAERKVFAVLEGQDALSMLHLQHQQVAIRRNDGHAHKENRPLKMVDMEKLDAGLLTGLATRKKYRHLGLTDEVMGETFAYEYQQKYGFTYVVPETELEKKTYEEYGFCVVAQQPAFARVIRQFSLDMLRACRHGNKLFLDMEEEVSITAALPTQLMQVAQFANDELAKQKGIFVIRNQPYYEKLIQELQSTGGDLFLCKREEQLVGYFAVADIEGEEDYREILFADRKLQEQLFREKTEPGRQVLARIVNLHSMIKHIKSDGKVTVAVRIEDPMIRDNNGIFLWFLDSHGCRMERVEDLSGMRASDQPKPELTVTIGELTSFLMGHLSLKENKKFDSILKVGPAWLTEIH